MEKTRVFLKANKDSFESYGYFDDHDIYYEVIEQKITSDNSIEACKALIEGVCKTILTQMDARNPKTRRRFLDHDLKAVDSTFQKMKGKTGEDFQPLFKSAVTVLSAHVATLEKEIILDVGNAFCKSLGRLRNTRGDISHGQTSPKIVKSSIELEKIVVSLTDVIVIFLLEALSIADFDSPHEEYSFADLVNEAFLLKDSEQLEDIDEEEQLLRDFNDDLDWSNPLPGKARYSLALFNQYPEDYEVQFRDYCDQLQNENAEAKPESTT
ncbi:hypothetical protein [Salinimonas sediminis]|uniref:Abortive infection protein-like C-terminal domain-containing protein n=1 Tax=Salinimonas sediminis TaxID=2303538 RepID=A0A346NHB2_9ALTE|nr:hypothetical protein [Salinimonas sediminis]AXR04919.1 hypothetical protein D0Y50_00165 [Salinimonas sediminis]